MRKLLRTVILVIISLTVSIPVSAMNRSNGTYTALSNFQYSYKMAATTGQSYKFGVRYYYSLIPAFTSIDPMAESYQHLSPYLFCDNDPVNKIDPSGMVFTEASQKYLDKFMSNIDSRIQKNNNSIAKKKTDLQRNSSGIGSLMDA